MTFERLKYSTEGDGVLLKNPAESSMVIVVTDVKIAGYSVYPTMLRDLYSRGALEIGECISLKPGESLVCPDAKDTVIEWIET